jgi:hypothetical protein
MFGLQYVALLAHGELLKVLTKASSKSSQPFLLPLGKLSSHMRAVPTSADGMNLTAQRQFPPPGTKPSASAT